eukprot:403346042
MESSHSNRVIEKCLSCGEIFDHRLRQKVFIPCGHVYCLKCMSLVSPQDNQYFCISCGKSIELTQAFKENLRNFIDQEHKLYVTCKLHQGQNANQFCHRCDTYACIYCVEEKHKQHNDFVEILSQNQVESEVKSKSERIREEIERLNADLNKLSIYENQAQEVDFNEFQNILKSVSIQENSRISSESRVTNNGIKNDSIIKKKDYIKFFARIKNKKVLDKMKKFDRVKQLPQTDYSHNREIRNAHTFSNGNAYLGEWNIQTNQIEGSGIHIWSDGSIYSGQWKDKKRNGRGIEIYSKGDVYEGQFVNDKIHGYGTYYLTSGENYQGCLVDGKYHGYGVYQWNDGRIYKGDWLNGMIHGKGVFTQVNGDIYEGEFIEDEFENYGMYTWADGRKYEGQWKNDKQHGYGKSTDKDGNISYDTWENGEIINEDSE